MMPRPLTDAVAIGYNALAETLGESMARAKEKGAIVYWIEAGSGELRSHMMESSYLLPGRTYEREVLLKYAVDPVEPVTIPLSRAGGDWEKSVVEQLRAKSAAMRAERQTK
jgi:hypothetical protein